VILQPKSNLGGHPLILGRPWLAIVDALISCISRNMIISKGNESKQVTLYTRAKSINELEKMSWFEETDSKEEIVHSLFNNAQYINFKEEDDEKI
jgi:hypothetical protein